MTKKQFTLYVENRPGVLAEITEELASEKINIEGISVSESTDVGIIQIVVSNAARTKKVLKASRVPFTVQDVAVLSLKNEPGALSGVVSTLAKQEVNVNYIYATAATNKGEGSSFVVISAPNLKKVEQACKQKK